MRALAPKDIEEGLKEEVFPGIMHL